MRNCRNRKVNRGAILCSRKQGSAPAGRNTSIPCNCMPPDRMRHPLQRVFAAYILESLPPPYTRRMTALCGQFWLERASRTNQAAKRRKLTKLK